MRQRPLPEFVALAVGQGDAFYLHRADHDILVDGGRGLTRLPRLFREVLGKVGVNVLICTHSDRDHAEGVLGFLREGLTADEIWLPGSWLRRLDGLISKPAEFVEELKSDVAELTPPYPPALGALGDSLSKGVNGGGPRAGSDSVLGPTRADFDQTILYHRLDDVCAEADFLAAGGPEHVRTRTRARLLREGISAAKIIRDIACEAHRHRLRVRWFEYRWEPVPSQPLDPRPVNCVEIAAPPPPVGALQYLALTRSNRESLVFEAESALGCPPVLFTADSDLKFAGQIRWDDGMIITAPHHGSQANVGAYERCLYEASQIGAVTWVRSDGWFRARPGACYKAMARRACTRCWGRPCAFQNVRLTLVCGRWRLLQSRPCACF